MRTNILSSIVLLINEVSTAMSEIDREKTSVINVCREEWRNTKLIAFQCMTFCSGVGHAEQDDNMMIFNEKYIFV